ncbi:Lipoprotein [Pseudoalteromonas phenolica]|uniref:Lipoprotein n=2 Tax=Pseudoalteromonas phenolica TaxID=161398 RepID=A0A0S2K915_9GAMM|nr:Lipoprotein [Pseudoalteromonas phenolica]
MALTASLVGCSATSTNTSNINETQQQINQNELVNTLSEEYFNSMVALSPISGTYMGKPGVNDKFDAAATNASLKKTQNLLTSYQQKLDKIDKNNLSGQALLSYEILKRDLAFSKRGFEFPSYMMPINQMSGLHNVFAGLGSGQSAQPFNTVEDYNNFISRADGFVNWLSGIESNMRLGITKEVVLPKALTKKLIPQFEAHIVEDVTQSVFWGPITNFPDSFTLEDKKALKDKYKSMILNKLVPAYTKMTTFLKEEYLPNSRNSVGYSALPNGEAWYEYQIATHTTLDLSADEIHKIGLNEVTRIRNEMEWVKEQLNFKGDLQAFFKFLREDEQFYFKNSEDLIAAYVEAKEKIDSRVHLLFDVAPKADYEVKLVEAFRAESAAGASYAAPAPDGTRPGVFYINAHNLKAQPKFLVETLSIHEAAPGHHFQIALQQEVKGLPSFRKFGGYTVFAEGWALYAESLGKDLGLFTDPLMWYGRLVDEQLRAMRLVVDTGLHSKGWSRDQAIKFMLDNSSMAESDVTAEVERYIGWPGQAVSYKVGQFKIQELRDYSEQKLGDKFDIKAFHTQILIDGALPMPILESKIKKWVEKQL